ncbi:Hypothetical protein, putative [Bodo saltans]|uniref:Uncharacterized protein n=1 Tax=Bodo saltans TaxID=75058 RepID=A0A0S4IYF2_BODSA|nr:Hypothetical protein, putative [Bodo saltans]|eukprot:CUG54262.1 Hypothetical protein, putative [Bodo saltans]
MLSNSTQAPPSELVTTFCSVCDVGIMGPPDGQNFLQHTSGKSHKKKAAAAGAVVTPTLTDNGSPLQHPPATAALMPSEWPPEAPFIQLTPSGPVRREELHRILSFRLISRDELSNGRHAVASGNVMPSPLASATDAQHFSHVVRTVLEHRPDVFVLQHVAGTALRELTRSFGRCLVAKDTYEWTPSPRFPEGTQPWTHHFLGYRRDKYRLLQQHPMMLHELVATRGRQDVFCEQSISGSHLAMDHAVAWVLLLEDIQQRNGAAPHRLLVVSVELPHGPDLVLFRECCARELQRHIGEMACSEAISKAPPSVVIVGDFGAPPVDDSLQRAPPLQGGGGAGSGVYQHLTSRSEPVWESLPLRLTRDTFTVALAYQPNSPAAADGAATPQRLFRCHAWFDCTPQWIGQHDQITSLDVYDVKVTSDRTRRVHKISVWDGSKLVALQPPSHFSPEATAGANVVSHIPVGPSVWNNINQRRGVIEWEEWGLLDAASPPSVDREASLSFVEAAVRVNGVHNAALMVLKEKPRRQRTCFRPGRWDDGISGMFRSAFSHYQLCCDGEQIPKSSPQEVEKLISQLEGALVPPQPAPYVGGPFVSSPPSTASADVNDIPNAILHRFLQPSSSGSPPLSTLQLSQLSAASTSLVRATCYNLRDWLRLHPSSPLCQTVSLTPVYEPLFTTFLPMRCDPLPGAVTPCRTNNFTTHFDRRRWQERFGGFEWGTYDYVLYLRDRMEVVKLARLPTLAEIGVSGNCGVMGALPSADLRYPSSHLPLCVEFWVPW